MFRALDRGLVAVTSVLVAALMATMAIAVLFGVFTRYVLNDALPWPEELARYAMIWMSWIGGGLALRRGAHIATDLAINTLPEGPRRVVLLVGNVLALGFLLIVLVFGLQLVGRVSMQSTIALGVSMQVPYAAVPIGAALMIYHLLIVMFAPGLELKRDTEMQA